MEQNNTSEHTAKNMKTSTGTQNEQHAPHYIQGRTNNLYVIDTF